ncbi:DUF1996 domain-containing protein [Nonomuraea sp. NPDC049421]|uniref:DUF1996 domain-containing protein n=1 Tax=Nonomuraea sp. NPDC049421 TaxID=3155275 RepID=UPI003438B3A4
MRRSRRMAAAVSALAVTATGLVSAAVIGVGPAVAAPCDPAQSGQSPQGRQSQQPGRNQQGQNQRDDDRFGRRQDQDQQDGQGQNRFGQDQQAPQGGSVAVDPQSPDDQDNPTTFSRRRQPTRSPSPTPSPTGNQGNPDNGGNNGDNGDNGSGDNDGADNGNNNGDNGNGGNNGDNGNGGNNGDNGSDNGNDPGNENGNDNGTGNDNGNGNGGDDDGDDDGDDGSADPSQSPSPSPTADDPCADLGPFAQDFVDIRQVQPRRLDARIGRGGSSGTFAAQCGTNRDGHNNPDNFIVAPGVSNGAHHLHDYVGNLSTDAFSTDESLAAAGTTCRLNDQSTYFWPVIRDRRSEANANDPDGNVGQVLRARSVQLQFRGNANSRVVAMPRFLRIITGDAKAATNGTANARSAWTCTGFQNRITTDKYPLCPRGSQVVRILDFPSCWDGQNTDSANHRTHIVFPDQNGACPQGTRAVPALRMTLTYAVPQGPSFALDAFPEQKHNPVTDHADFVNVMPDRLMQNVVSCINRGRRC